jgi:transcriptional regulator with PAS, ATPase and Fis domain
MRREDIPALVVNILEKFRREKGIRKKMEPEVLDFLIQYDYPGNVRELINLMERMIIMSEGESITQADLPGELKESTHTALEAVEEVGSLKEAVAAFEGRMIVGALRRHGSLAGAARGLKVHQTTLWRKMVRYGLSVRQRARDGIAIPQ